MSTGELRADCGRCFGLCCVAPTFVQSADFAFTKAAGEACGNLLLDSYGCSIHAELRQRGMNGCTAYDCFGAGQHLSQVTFAGVSWQQEPSNRPAMFALLQIVRALHELLWLVREALTFTESADLEAASAELEEIRLADPDLLLVTDVDALRARINPLLRAASEAAREPLGRDLRGRDLVGASFSGADLERADLRGSVLIGADLRDASLELADLTGADLRGTDLSGADLSGALFLTQMQVDAAIGDAGTLLPEGLWPPDHWSRRRTRG